MRKVNLNGLLYKGCASKEEMKILASRMLCIGYGYVLVKSYLILD